MGKSSNLDARKFQDCTVKKVIKEIFESNVLPKRFLVADEVGLGKTIIAKHVINYLREDGGRQVVIYVSSSLDITRQNRIKLAVDPDKEIVHADRINLLYKDGPLASGIQIVTMTPGTSLSLERSLGSFEERAFISDIVRDHYVCGLARLTTIFKGAAHTDNFYKRLHDLACNKSSKRNALPRIEVQICKRWEQITLSNNMTFLQALKSLMDKELFPELIRKMRKEMAIAILENLNPKLVIFDEFQKFRELTEVSDTGSVNHELGKILLKPEIPTLLLSATPYRLFTSTSTPFDNKGALGHYHDLEKTFSFLSGSPKKSKEIIEEVQKYGQNILKVTKENLKQILESKTKIESDVMKYMSRTERVNFGDPNLSISTRRMSQVYNGGDFTKENFKEFFKISRFAESQGQLINYWKSGSHPLSYMYSKTKTYTLIKNAVERSNEENLPLDCDPTLYSPLSTHPAQNIKLKYVYEDTCLKGKAFDYLWIPASRPYYNAKGIFSKEVLAKSSPKKGLIFSSWMFVPRLVAAEINAQKMQYFKKYTESKLQPSAEGLAKLFFPSTLLMEALTQNDFLQSQDYKSVYNIAFNNIKAQLLSLGFNIIKGSRGLSISQILAYAEFGPDDKKWKKYQSVMKRGSFRLGSHIKDPADFSKVPFTFRNDGLEVSIASISSLAEIAIASPSVTLFRAIVTTLKTKLSEESWLFIAAFCLHNVRTYVNREANMKVFIKNGKRGEKPLEKVLEYFMHGNIQAVFDEYAFLAMNDKSSEKGVTEFLKKLAHVFAPTRSSVTIPTSRKRAGKTIHTDFACCFGEGAEESNSRDTNREAFNSPFWPLVLSTTSVGQEGLDFHLYCKDIYHWNLPSNPVDFEQREGRLNRYNNYAIRQNIMMNIWANNRLSSLDQNFWDYCFEKAQETCHRNDRYSLGMSPHWIYTPMVKEPKTITRHVLDLPCSNDIHKYQRLMDDLSFYRLALGQPDQKEFVRKLQGNAIFKSIDLRSITLDFFPSGEREVTDEIDHYFKDRPALEVLLKDCLEHVAELKGVQKLEELKFQVQKHVSIVKFYLTEKKGTKAQFESSVEALYYFMDPFDHISDRNPLNGFMDDLKKLKAA